METVGFTLKFTQQNLSPNIIFESWAFGGNQGGALVGGINYKKKLGHCELSFLSCKDTTRRWPSANQKERVTKLKHADTPTSDFQPPEL